MYVGTRKWMSLIGSIGAVIVLSVGIVNARGIKVYKWRGSHGVIHYSQVPPRKSKTGVKRLTLGTMPPVDETIVRADRTWSQRLMRSIRLVPQPSARAREASVKANPYRAWRSQNQSVSGWGISQSRYLPFYWGGPRERDFFFRHGRQPRYHPQPHRRFPKVRPLLIHNTLPSGHLQGRVPRARNGGGPHAKPHFPQLHNK